MANTYGFSLEEIEARRQAWQKAAEQRAAIEPQITLAVIIPDDMQEVIVAGELNGGNLKAGSEGRVGLGRALLNDDAVLGLFQGVISALHAHRFHGG